MMTDIEQNLEEIREKIRISAKNAGRTENDILLLAVTKTIDTMRMKEAQNLGISAFGENRIQEFRDKVDSFEQNIDWHIIGRLQKNKIKYIIGRVELVHSLCSISVAKEMQRLAEEKNEVVNCLIEMNLTGEETKDGLKKQELLPFLEEISLLSNINIKGLMTIPRYSDNPEDSRPCFRALKELFDLLKKQESERLQMRYLSMGMSGDYQVAIEEGANIIRVGTAIFGKR